MFQIRIQIDFWYLKTSEPSISQYKISWMFRNLVSQNVEKLLKKFGKNRNKNFVEFRFTKIWRPPYPEFDLRILCHSGIWGVADEAVLISFYVHPSLEAGKIQDVHVQDALK